MLWRAAAQGGFGWFLPQKRRSGRVTPRRETMILPSLLRLQTVPRGRSHDLPRFTKVCCQPKAFYDFRNASEDNVGPAVQDGFCCFWRPKWYLGRVIAGYGNVTLPSLRRLQTVPRARSHDLPRSTKVCCQSEAFPDFQHGVEANSGPAVQGGFDWFWRQK